jgi:hypothetical protein
MQRVSQSQRVSAYSAENPPAIRVGMGETFVMETNDRFQGYTSPDDAPLDLLMSMTGPVYVGGVEPGDTLSIEVVSITPRRDGLLHGEFMSKSDTGQWSVRSGQLCIRFSKWLNGRTSCAAVVEQAGWYQTSDVKFREAERWALPVRAITR